MKWVIDSLDVVHVQQCEYIYEGFEPYLSAPQTLEEMVDRLAGPDIAAGHEGIGPLAPCFVCILGNDPEESYPPSLQARCTVLR